MNPMETGLQIGELVDGKYRVLSVVGRGGMSVVYLAINEKANKQWAIKEVRKDMQSVNADYLNASLMTETNLLRELSHPHIPQIIDVIGDETRYLIVMDYIEGNPLSYKLQEEGALPEEKVVHWAKQLCDILGYLHQQKDREGNPKPIIYRDTKPANIMLNPNGNDITLIDFGIAREFKSTGFDTVPLGSRGYAAPEQYEGGRETDARTDIYNFGRTLFHLLTGVEPKDPSNIPIRNINPALSEGLERIILKCTQHNREDRYQDTAELLYDLDHYQIDDAKTRRREKRRLLSFCASAIFSLLFAGVSVFAHVAAQNENSKSYTALIEAAGNTALSLGDRITTYQNAIRTNTEKIEAYEGLVEALIEDNDLSVEDGMTLENLTLELPANESFRAAKKPLESLKKSQEGSYQELCQKIGEAYWYYYRAETKDGKEGESRTKALPWFKLSQGESQDLSVYVKMGKAYDDIQKALTIQNGEGINEAFYKLFQQFYVWEQQTQDGTVKDSFSRFKAWKEMVKMISDNASFFVNAIRANEGEVQLISLSDFLNVIETDIAKEKQNNPDLVLAMKASFDELDALLDETQNKVDSATKSMV